MKTAFMFVSPPVRHGVDMAVTTQRAVLSRRSLFTGRPVTKRSQSARDPERQAVAHVLGRLAMSPHPDRVAELSGRSAADTIAALFDDATLRRHAETKAPTIGSTDGDQDRDDDLTNEDVTAWWLDQMIDVDSGLVDRMAWFWHGHLTTNANKVDDPHLVATQLDTLRSGGLGNFRALLHDVITGGAMLRYLDANWSEASNPNENLARELMELFTMGRGHYSEDDVRAGARALAGWVVEPETEDGPTVVRWERERAFVAPLIFLGEQADWDTAKIIDRLCDDPATAVFVASKVWDHLVRKPLSPEARTDLGSWWADQDLEIRPLVERICADDAFATSIGAGVRSPIDWWCATATATGHRQTDAWSIQSLGQYPYAPPNVGGWPGAERWLSPGSMLSRSWYVHSGEPSELDLPRDTEAILDRCSLFAVDPSTREAIEAVASIPDIDDASLVSARWRLALSSPEFQLS